MHSEDNTCIDPSWAATHGENPKNVYADLRKNQI